MGKRHELKILIANLLIRPQVIAITEIKSKRSNSLNIAELSLDGYKVYTNDLELCSRGVLVYVDECLDSKIINIESQFEEIVTVQINGLEDKIILGNFYRSPNSNSENDNHMYKLIKDICELERCKVVLLGDFNFPDIDWEISEGKERSSINFIQEIRDNFLIQNVKECTRARGEDTPHLLDLVLSNDNIIEEIVFLSPLGKSDHCVMEVKCEWQKKLSPQSTRSNFNKGDYERFRLYLKSQHWFNMLNVYKGDIEGMWNVFKEIVLKGMELFIPKVNNFANFKKPFWKMPLSQEVRQCIKDKNNLWKKYIATRDNAIHEQYKRTRNYVRNHTRDLFKKEQNKIARECKLNPKKFWKYVNSKTRYRNSIGDLVSINDQGKEEKISDNQEKANILCDYFSSVFNKKSEITEVNILDKDVQQLNQIEIGEEDIIKRLNKLNVYKSPGPDLLHPRVLKEVRNEIAYPLKLIFECSLKTTSLPNDWKSGNITPIYKKGKKCNVSNYRPVSITSIVCKVLESIIRDSVIKHLHDNNLFSKKQYGFIKGRSTVSQLLSLLDEWTEALEQGGQIDVIYTDLEKAFDKVPHNQLLRKLKSYNLNDQIINWVKSFLTDRRQRVRISESFSKWEKVLSGIPQGSILGPLLFIIYINDLEESCSLNSNVALYADDTKLYKYIQNENDAIKLQEDLNSVCVWIKKWLLSLNIDKCKVISYGRKAPISYNYRIDDCNLEKINEIKDLGVIFDSKLKFSAHINEKVNKAFSVLGIINRNFKYMEKNTFILLYKSMVRPHLEYANLVWSPYRKEEINKLERVQRRATKLVCSLKKLSYEERLKKLNLPTLSFRRLRGDMIEVYKIITGKYEKKDIDLKVNNAVNTRGNHYKLYQGQSRYDIRKYFFANRVVAVWNSLPDYVVMVDSTLLFKKRLDKFWSNQAIYFNFEAPIEGVGSRSHLSYESDIEV
jgi:hypothetical protein